MFVSSNRSNFEPEKTLLATVASDIPTTMTSAQTSQTQNLYQCRLCLKRTPTRVNIFGGDFPKMLEILTSIKVHEKDGLPKYSCLPCATEVKQAVATQIRIRKAYQYLKESLNKRHTPKLSAEGTADIDQSSQKRILNKQTIVESNRRIEPKKNVDRKLSTVSINKNSEALAKPVEDTLRKVGEVEDLDKNKNDNDAFITSVTRNKRSQPKSTGITKGSTVSVNKNNPDSQKLETPKEPEIEFNPEASTFNENIRLLNDTKHKKQTTCKICRISFSNTDSFYRHSLKHKKAQCSICNLVLMKTNMKKHMLRHKDTPAICHLCGLTYKNVESLRTHIYYQHLEVNAFICEECGRKFKKQSALNVHKNKVHTGERNFKCATCGKTFFTKKYLKSHEMTHKKLRPCICEYCNVGFSTRHALKIHRRQHTNEKPFVCDKCDESFRQRVSLRNHLKSKHAIEEAKEFVCSECGRGFATDYALNIHRRLHAFLKCEVCSESFADREYLYNHMKEAHGADNDTRDKGQDTGENQKERRHSLRIT
ncbi:unnamed protein product [Acanthoscelides obtectus]|uniref:Uncharacterized protein n=1 Tax=Acanthoscelides obtectus TaxID=200917 RepID=A0A9P0KWG9_ACAOB|nr:unnamed protein product [Acanthoscelides obtectus]CAK1631234.1 hypothetical protein AOBTE_LOCUS6827 [Acanthoscelides obtectus]